LKTNDRAIRLSLRDPDLTRNRLTVGFRLILAIPHLVWMALWFTLAATVATAQWLVLLISAKPSPELFRFTAAYVRYAAQVVAYVTLVADPYPRFTGDPGYPVEVEIDAPQRQNRWLTGFRVFLALPAVLLADSLMGGGVSFSGGSIATTGGVAGTAAFLGWFACLARGSMPQGLRDAGAYCIGYSAQVTGYLLLLTDRFPNSDPAVYEATNVYRSDPIRVTVDDDLRRSRLTVFFRLALTTPHLVWLILWGIPVFFALIANWFATLFRGSSPPGLHRFLAAYARYQVHVFAYLQLTANLFPGFTGRAGSYPIDVEIDPPGRQSRPVTGFRLILGVPAFFMSSALGGAGWVAAFLTWFHALARGTAPRGLRNLNAYQLRYYAQTLGYVYLLTDSYPYSGPSAGWQLALLPEAESPPPQAS
jgi:hypothetical protein